MDDGNRGRHGGAAGTPGVRRAIVGAARRLLEERGVEEALTLRAVARGAGITAPSVYNHFHDLAAVLEEVIVEALADYDAATTGAAVGIEDPLEAIRAAALGYIRFAREQPATYRLLFSRHQPTALPRAAARAALNHQGLVDAIAACVPLGRPASADAAADAVALWTALHGAADLPPAHPRFPWPPEQDLVDRLLRRLVLCESA